MTSLLGQVADYLLRWASWLAVLVALAVAGAALPWMMLRPRPGLRRTLPAAVAGAVIAASLADRFDLAGPEFDVWRLPVPWLWAIVGGLAGLAVRVLLDRRHRGSA